ncbi:vWA domain-containing protein [Thermomonospora curvata]|uniref:TROVE domain protein n=1 Tax=Thermomonospora curvata (strain ATCC 19995 / DSM 43183 / JCM 3096 / KCTC 9072 / NBRC 15933 / NCIMB 10081 / Henssen B9) TaxID=471852 RepID=D1A5P3_THECD|nr:TROVE domain-containing protein [Thermomonospora curvata]ACY96403.1 TROVE domain protein [Thermomonospora curvata DSM 43183]
MAKFNRVRRKGATSPIKTADRATGRTHEGAPGHLRDTKSELFLLAVSNMVGEQTFYEGASARDARFRTLVGEVALHDPGWLTRMIGWLRNEAGMRSASVVAAAEGVMSRLCASAAGGNRRLIDAALQRADEPGELIAYWHGRYGRALPQPVKRGIADAVRRLYDERSLIKYDSGEVRFGDVLELTHPAPVAPWQGDLFKHAIDRRHGRGRDIPRSLTVLRARAELLALPVGERRALLERPDAPQVLAAAGMTWESLAGWVQGPLTARFWEAIIPSMGLFALLRNLRNFDRAGIGEQAAEAVAARLADPAQVRRSKLLPIRFLAAYRQAPSPRWAWPLQRALDASLANVPRLPGRTLVLVDRSGSMFTPMSARSKITQADAAAVFGTALALRAEHADLVQFGTTHQAVPFRRGEPVLKVVERFDWLGGTDTAEAVRAHYRGHDRVVIVTDEQAWAGPHGAEPTAAVPEQVPVYTWNLVGYQYGHGPSGTGTRHTFGGLSDAAFAMIPLLERGQKADWPF